MAIQITRSLTISGKGDLKRERYLVLWVQSEDFHKPDKKKRKENH